MTLPERPIRTSAVSNGPRRVTFTMFETPIPQEDILGNRQIRASIARPVAMHFGSPPYVTALREEVCDGFVINGGATAVLRQGALSAEAGMPFWLQLVGNGMTTTWAAHLGAVLSHATWPTISCVNLYSHQLLKKKIDVIGGYHQVPDGPGLGVEVDEKAVEKAAMEKLVPAMVVRLRQPLSQAHVAAIGQKLEKVTLDGKTVFALPQAANDPDGGLGRVLVHLADPKTLVFSVERFIKQLIANGDPYTPRPVSYTHLTLPTILLV